MTTFKQINVLADRPADIPASWHILNAPRPLYGDRTWQGEFRQGVHFAAVDPAGDRAAEMLAENAALHAVLLRYVSEADVRAMLAARLSGMGFARSVDEYTRAQCWQSYCASGAAERTVEV